ncbi:Uncharacterized protein TCM_010182 [Theobroma cacao]|uniref:Uncharacterized protein n=1 Tax=Theobroma cacao TaxID=3641 RepID=A0A061E7J4_THECC|nr:Uncharacterized protein TCM_010182 [Theobroma cacao]
MHIRDCKGMLKEWITNEILDAVIDTEESLLEKAKKSYPTSSDRGA